jgi:Holliday junction resolvasome RuvABC DNA-binding subunit
MVLTETRGTKMSKKVEVQNPVNNLVEDNSRSKSSKIRALYGLGFSKSQIALMLGIRYQHVRNVLLQELKGQK